MRAIIRSLIVWMVLLAVPFQGYASAAMLGCAPATAAPQIKAAAHHTDMAGHDHAHHAQHDGKQADHHASKCSNCAACCIGVAIMPPAIEPVAVHAPSAHLVPFDGLPLPSVHLALPERPPRFAFA